jgi:CheY-like chemotaxis protein
MMPKMDGYEAMRRIRRHDDQSIRNIPVVALTAKAMRGDHERCIEAGANDYLPKPINMENLTTVLKVWLSKETLR